MINNIGSREEYAISTWLYEKRSLTEALASIKRGGFQEVELWGNNVHADPRVIVDQEQIRKILKASGVHVHSIHAPFSGFGSMFPEPSFLSRWADVILKTIELCHSIETSLMVFHVLHREEYNFPTKEVPRIYDFLEDVVHQGEKRGVTLLLENLTKGSLDDEYSCTIRNLVRDFSALDVGYCIDISHTALTQQDVVEEIALTGSRLMSVHVSNTYGGQDVHTLPSDGVINWPMVRQAFLSSGYKGKFVLEINGLDNPDGVFQEICSLFD